MKKIKASVINLFHLFFLITLKLNFSRINALATLIFIKKRTRAEKRKFRVLAIGKAIFSEDVEALSVFGSKCEYYYLPITRLLYIIRRFLPYENLTDKNYYTNPEFLSGREKLKLYFEKYLHVLIKIIRFDAIIASNFVYISIQELALVAWENNIPFIVIYKEGMAPSSSYQDYVKIYKPNRSRASKILLYNNNIRRALLSANVEGITEENTAVVGVPRLDFYFNSVTRNSFKKNIVLFSFYLKDKLFYLESNKEKIKLLHEKSDYYHLMFLEFAKNNPDYKVVIKTKASKHYVDYVLGLFHNYTLSDIPNLSITNSIPAKKLITEAEFVAGYTSTTLLEAIIMDKPIICPDFREIIKLNDSDYFKDYPELVNYINSLEELEAFIKDNRKYIRYKEERKRKFLEPMILKMDGKASIRAENELVQEILKHKELAINGY